MTDSANNCPEGWEPAQILAYIEGHLEPQAESVLAMHLRECPICALEFESLGRMDSLLRNHPEVFHPDEQRLYAFASGKLDEDAQVESHLKSCPECAENVRVFTEMIGLRDVVPAHAKMPKAIERQIELICDSGERSVTTGFFNFVSSLLKKPFSVPFLGLASAAAVLMLAVLIIPLWTSFKGLPQRGVAPVAEKTANIEMDQPVESQDPKKEVVAQAHLERAKEKPEAPKVSTAPVPAPSRPAAPPPEPTSAERKSKSDLESAPREETPGSLQEVPLHTGSDREFSARMSEKRRRQESEADKSEQVPRQARGSMGYKFEDRAQQTVGASNKAKKHPAKVGEDSRVPVRVMITDPEGKPIQWVRFAPDSAMEGRYAFVGSPKSNEATSEEEAAPEAQAPALHAETGYIVIVKIGEIRGVCEIEAKLFQAGRQTDSKPLKTVVESNIRREVVQERVAFLVRSLLAD
ncbi:MAG: hypothetical protein HY912_07945 [Desulfomonile tiedjei]|uniref:Zinc-finger domain-containing protein n=1 Tax=Desulfomonile tiedjei TaxID=2358 RepID=A0A9D6UZQ7_9BACT|nr:hypothetical protein [Desulfomonile tiedjei]